jgi:plasmid stability protein
MSSLVIRNIEENIKQRLSMEAEARLIIEKSVSEREALTGKKIGTTLTELFAGCGELEAPARSEAPREIAL